MLRKIFIWGLVSVLICSIGFADTNESDYIVKTDVFKNSTVDSMTNTYASRVATVTEAIILTCNEYDAKNVRKQFSEDFRERFIFGVLQGSMQVFVSKFEENVAIILCISNDYIYILAISPEVDAIVIQASDGLDSAPIKTIVTFLEEEYNVTMDEIEAEDCEEIARMLLNDTTIPEKVTPTPNVTCTPVPKSKNTIDKDGNNEENEWAIIQTDEFNNISARKLVSSDSYRLATVATTVLVFGKDSINGGQSASFNVDIKDYIVSGIQRGQMRILLHLLENERLVEIWFISDDTIFYVVPSSFSIMTIIKIDGIKDMSLDAPISEIISKITNKQDGTWFELNESDYETIANFAKQAL